LRGGLIQQGVASLSWKAPGFAQTDDDPVVCVSWEDATAFAAWLSSKSGKRYRLLSEAEWEYVARADESTGRNRALPNVNACQFANLADQSARNALPGFQTSACNDHFAFTAPKGKFPPNAFGLFDVLGNAWEWVNDCWNKNYAGAPGDGSAWSSGKCEERVFRGGGWNSATSAARPGYRDHDAKTERHDTVGFRVVREVE
jgi:formylglycine-generating enzyme required for sulfatase activity